MFKGYVVILPSQVLGHYRRYCLPVGSTDFERIGVRFARIYSQPQCGAIGFSSRSRVGATVRRAALRVRPIRRAKATVTPKQTKNPTLGLLDHAGGLQVQHLHHCLYASALGIVTQRSITLIGRVRHNDSFALDERTKQALKCRRPDGKLAELRTNQTSFELRSIL